MITPSHEQARDRLRMIAEDDARLFSRHIEDCPFQCIECCILVPCNLASYVMRESPRDDGPYKEE